MNVAIVYGLFIDPPLGRAGGDEAVHALAAAMYADAPYTTVTRSVFIHPTVSEELPTVLGALKPLA